MKLRGCTGITITLEEYFKNAVENFETTADESEEIKEEFKNFIDSDTDYIPVSDNGEKLDSLSLLDEIQYDTEYNNALSELMKKFERGN